MWVEALASVGLVGLGWALCHVTEVVGRGVRKVQRDQETDQERLVNLTYKQTMADAAACERAAQVDKLSKRLDDVFADMETVKSKLRMTR